VPIPLFLGDYWLKGALNIGLGDFQTIDLFGEPDKLICLKIEKGKVIEKWVEG